MEAQALTTVPTGRPVSCFDTPHPTPHPRTGHTIRINDPRSTGLGAVVNIAVGGRAAQAVVEELGKATQPSSARSPCGSMVRPTSAVWLVRSTDTAGPRATCATEHPGCVQWDLDMSLGTNWCDAPFRCTEALIGVPYTPSDAASR